MYTVNDRSRQFRVAFSSCCRIDHTDSHQWKVVRCEYVRLEEEGTTQTAHTREWVKSELRTIWSLCSDEGNNRWLFISLDIGNDSAVSFSQTIAVYNSVGLAGSECRLSTGLSHTLEFCRSNENHVSHLCSCSVNNHHHRETREKSMLLFSTYDVSAMSLVFPLLKFWHVDEEWRAAIFHFVGMRKIDPRLDLVNVSNNTIEFSFASVNVPKNWNKNYDKWKMNGIKWVKIWSMQKMPLQMWRNATRNWSWSSMNTKPCVFICLSLSLVHFDRSVEYGNAQTFLRRIGSLHRRTKTKVCRP